MKTLMDILKFLLPLIPVFLAVLLPLALNLKKKKRHLQMILPVVALIYGIVFLIFVDDISLKLLGWIYWLMEKIQPLIQQVPSLEFLNKINWSYGVLYVANLAMVLLFVAVKAVFLLILMFQKPEKSGLTKKTTGLFYEFDEKDQKWYIKNKFAQVKRVMLVIYIGVLVFSGLLFAVTCYFISKELLEVPFYPMFGILILGECYYFMCGLPKGGEAEAEGEIPEDEEKEEPPYKLLKEAYEQLFGDRLCGSAELPPTSDKRSSVDQLLEEYRREAEETGSHDVDLIHRYFYQMSQREDVELDDGFITAARNILGGKNVLFNTPFCEDTTEYIFLPITRNLLKNQKLLVVVGRTGADQSIIRWLRKGLFAVNNFEELWKIDYLSESDESTKIAILPMKDIYNQKLLFEKAEFLENTSLVMVMDPARLLGTMQVGLSNLVSYLRCGVTPQYIAFDRNCDGLVDSLSHVLNSSFEEVTATVVGSAESTAMVWAADGKGLHSRLGLDTARYLGVGTELGALAASAEVSRIQWLAYDKFPATDIRWIVSQYYGPLCKVMGIPTSQTKLENKLNISADIWSMPKGKDAFVVAEDEYNNPYEIIRQFSTRANKQAFVHVLSPNYLLRDYMCDNAEIFTYDPKAIPNFVADYQRVRNNAVCRIVMRMINGEIYEEEILEALELVGIEPENVKKDMTALILQYLVPESDAPKSSEEEIITLRYELVINRKTRRPERKKLYSIENEAFIERFLTQLQVVRYVAEDEQDKNLYINSILYGHIYQKYLPGTFTVLDGKYYEVVSITRNAGMIVRRAADHVTKRRYYRQLRTYTVDDFRCRDGVASTSTFGKITLERGEAAVRVNCAGYLEMEDYGDIKNAGRVLLSGIPERTYPHKNILRFKLDGAPEKVRFTVADMMNELLVTLFPDMHEYIVVTTKMPEEQPEGYIPTLVTEDEDDYIYVIEDSLIDIGLLINVERYFQRILEIITDQLNWHSEQLKKEEEEGEEGGDEPVDEPEEGGDDTEEAPKKKSWWQRFVDWLKRIFGRKKAEQEPGTEEGGPTEQPGSEEESGGSNPQPGPEDEPIAPVDEPVSSGNEEAGGEEKPAETEKKPGFWQRLFGKKRRKAADGEPTESPVDAPVETPVDVPNDPPAEPPVDVPNDLPAEPTEEFPQANYTSFTFTRKEFSVIDDNEGAISGEDEESVDVDVDNPDLPKGGSEPGKRLPYSQRHYMLYGYDKVPESFDLDATLEYLRKCGFEDNYLFRARGDAKGSKLKWYNHRFEPGAHYCDFCGTKLEGTISVMKDGRERCANCKSTAITKVRAFRRLYKQTHVRMEEVFGIKINSHISIKITNAKTIAKECGYEFKPTPRFDGRALGFAQQLGNGKTRIMLENGAPRLETEKTLVHELTHVWQYENMDCLWHPRDLVAIEGMAVWTEAQYLMCNNEEERADAYVRGRTMENSEYGQGMREYIRKYPLRKGRTAKGGTPFSRPGKNPLN